jgi:hypothetical protein
MNSPEMPLDLQGPIDRPFDRMGADFAGAPAIEHLKAVARRFADRIAMSDGTHHVTYSDFLARALRLAQAIAAVTSEGEAVGSFWAIRSGSRSLCWHVWLLEGSWSRSIHAIRPADWRISPRLRGFLG